MRSIRTKITTLTVFAIVASMVMAMLLAAVAIQDLGTRTGDQLLYLLCETGEKNLDSYFESVAQSVETVSGYAEADLAHVELDRLQEHLDRVSEVFEKTASHTAGILTYYYRIDPEISVSSKGFWFVDLDGEGFQEHEVTDITLYDTEDQSALVWFTVPKATGTPVWLPPYFTDNLDVYVLSYNVPIYKEDRFIGVIGIEIDYSTMVEAVNSISLYDNGYAFVSDGNGVVVYHPRMSMEELIGGELPQTPEGLLSESANVRYHYQGVEKQAVWLPLSNGMRLYVTVPITEINGDWHKLLTQILAVSAVLLLVFIVAATHFSEHITSPLRELTAAAEQVNAGNYEFDLEAKTKDEVGVLTRTFGKLVGHLKIYISDLNSLAYADALTSVHNKGAYDIFVRELQAKLEGSDAAPAFAVGVFDCDGLKQINDRFGHDKGDVYLKCASALICGVFQHSPVFRTGGDEFTLVLQNDDYQNREALTEQFAAQCDRRNAAAAAEWEQVRVSMGLAVFDPKTDRFVIDVARRADKLMYENKRARKAARQQTV